MSFVANVKADVQSIPSFVRSHGWAIVLIVLSVLVMFLSVWLVKVIAGRIDRPVGFEVLHSADAWVYHIIGGCLLFLFLALLRRLIVVQYILAGCGFVAIWYWYYSLPWNFTFSHFSLGERQLITVGGYALLVILLLHVIAIIVLSNSPPKPWVRSVTKQIKDEYYQQAWTELNNGDIQEGIWVRLLANNKGDEAKTRAAYLTERVNQLITARVNQLKGGAPASPSGKVTVEDGNGLKGVAVANAPVAIADNKDQSSTNDGSGSLPSQHMTEKSEIPKSTVDEEGKLPFTLPSDTKVYIYLAIAIIGLPLFFYYGNTNLEVIAFSSIPVRLLLVAPIAATLWLLLAGWGRRHSRSYYVRLKSAGWLAVAPFLVQGMGAPFTTAVGVLMTRILWGLVIMGVVVFIAMPIYFVRSRRIVDERKG